MDVHRSYLSAVRAGNLNDVRELIRSHGLNYSAQWAGGYVILREALEYKQVAVAKLLLSNGARVASKRQTPGNTLLHFAVKTHDTEIVEMLLSNYANVNARNKVGVTPLHMAIESQNLEVVEILLKHYANVDAVDDSGGRPLHGAVELGNFLIIETLLKYGAKIDCVRTSKWGNGYAPLHIAVDGGNKEVIALLLSKGADVDIKAKGNITPLHIAAVEGYTFIVDQLLSHGASTQSTSSEKVFIGRRYRRPLEGYMPLHAASASGHEDVVELLLNRSADINARTKNDSTPLHIAIKERRYKVIILLLGRGADVDIQDKDGKTALHLAVAQRYSVIVEEILKYCPDVNNESNRSSLITAALAYKSENIVEALLKYGLTVDSKDANNAELLHASVEKGYLKIVEDLLKSGADVNMILPSGGFTPLHSAAKNRQKEVAKLLLSHNADVNAKNKLGETPISCAVENIDSNITRLLLTNGAYVKNYPKLLLNAIEKGSPEIVEALLQHDADVNGCDVFGRTPLHFTAWNGNDLQLLYSERESDPNIMGKIAELLLSKGAYVDSRTKRGLTTLHAASHRGYARVVEALLERRANVNAEIEDGSTALHIATRRCNAPVVAILLEHGARVDSKMKSGTTPLHLAAQNGDLKIIETLLNFGADVNSQDRKGWTALHTASLKGHGAVVENLLEHGSDINITTEKNHTPLDHALFGIRSFQNQRRYRDYNDSSDSDDDRDYDPIFDPHEETSRALKRHLVKMKTANLYLSEYNLRAIRRYLGFDYDDDLYVFQHSCTEEIARAMRERFGGTNITFYDILAKETSSLEIWLRNEEIIRILEADDYKTKFPTYASMMKCHIIKVMERKDLLVRSWNAFQLFSSNLSELPRECIEKIFSYMSNKDLKILMDAFEPLRLNRERKELSEHGIQMFFHLSHLPELPHDCFLQIFSYLSNEDLKILLEAFEPLRISLERSELLELANKTFHRLTNLAEFPRGCAAEILSYLRNEDLKMLTKACEPLGTTNPEVCHIHGAVLY